MNSPRNDRERDIDSALGRGVSRDETLALAAALAAMAMRDSARSERLPASLRDRLEADAARHFAPTPPTARGSGAWKVAAVVGWLATAASWLVTAGYLMPPPVRPIARPAPVETVGRSAELRASDHPLARGGRGELVWDQASQSGRLRVEGLAGVDPGKGIYQLWIFDSDRDPRYPIDGGTFAVADASATTVVPVRAGLRVGRPTLFAITLEPPGGVVVSDRQRVMLTAAYP